MAPLFGGDPAAAKRRKAKRAAKQLLASHLASDTAPAALSLRAASEAWKAAGASNTKATLPAKEAAAALLKTGLPNELLAQIWNLSKRPPPQGLVGAMAFSEFSAALRLCALAQLAPPLLDSGVTVGRALRGELSLAPTMEAVPKPPNSGKLTLLDLGATHFASPPAREPEPAGPSARARPEAAAAAPPPEAPEVSPAAHVLELAKAAEAERRRTETATATADDSSDEESASPRSSGGWRKPAFTIQAAPSSPRSQPARPTAVASPPGFASRPAPQVHAAPPPPLVVAATLHEEQRLAWAGSRLACAGVRGALRLLPDVAALPLAACASPGSASEMRAALSGPQLACAAMETRSGRVAHGPSREEVPRPFSASACEAWSNADRIARDPDFLAASAPTRLSLRGAGACAEYRLGPAAVAPLLRAALFARPIAVPLASGLAVALVLQPAQPLHSAVIRLHLGSTLRSPRVLKAFPRGEWCAVDRVFTWRIEALHPAPPLRLRLHAAASGPGGDDLVDAPLHAVLTAQLGGGDVTTTAAGLLSGLMASVEVRGGGVRTTAALRATVFATEADAVSAVRAASLAGAVAHAPAEEPASPASSLRSSSVEGSPGDASPPPLARRESWVSGDVHAVEEGAPPTSLRAPLSPSKLRPSAPPFEPKAAE